MNIFSVGDKVTLTVGMRQVALAPEKYESGIVERIGSWGVVDVRWNGFDHSISMKNNEIVTDKCEEEQ